MSQNTEGHDLNGGNIRPDDLLKVVPLSGNKGTRVLQLPEGLLADKKTTIKIRLLRNWRDFICREGNSASPSQLTSRLSPPGEVLAKEREGMFAFAV